MENQNIEYNRWIGNTKYIKDFYLSSTDIEEIELDLSDEWDVTDPTPSVMVWIGDNLKEKIKHELNMTAEEAEGLNNYGWIDVYVSANEECTTIEKLWINAYFDDLSEKFLSIQLDMPDMQRKLFNKLCEDESYREYINECLEEKKETEMEQKAHKEDVERVLSNFKEALDILKGAFENLNEYVGHAYIDDTFWCPEKYPFKRSFDDTIQPVREWVEACKAKVDNVGLEDEYQVVVYMSDIIPNWNGNDNLANLIVDGKMFYQWYLENIAKENAKARTVEAFNCWFLEVYDADETIGLYQYAVVHDGLIEVTNY